jgi:beta-1,4-mannooligosaccharide/beta-1,4-mannosyl-N-acetylglucosamine phosphorylase
MCILKRNSNNPILTRHNIPDISPDLVDATSVFNPGAVKFNNRYLLMLRVQNRGRETFSLMAESKDGINFEVDNKIISFRGIEKVKEKIYHCYDPRITKIGSIYYIMFAMDMDNKCRLGLAKTEDFSDFEFMGIVSDDDNRNGVLFSEKVGGKFLRFDRPNKVLVTDGPKTGSAIVLSESDDLVTWKQVDVVISGRLHYWDELIGAGPPPIKTRQGWLQIYHGVALHLASIFIYQAGVMLLDLKNPAKVISRCLYNILEPRELYELTGQVPNVVFPSGVIVEDFDSEGFAEPDSKVLVYYGAADTSVGLATTTIKTLIKQAMIRSK